eukprot:Rhum_TRINITY_DN15185_c6_g1::Rhum_TRINITY_DN15185_c6_g1_i1::g.142874::m.142874
MPGKKKAAKSGGGAAGDAGEANPKDAEAVKVVKSGDMRKVEKFFDANPGCVNATNKKGQSLLMIAVENGHADVAEDLLDRGAKVEGRDAKGSTVLHYSITEEEDILSVAIVRRAPALLAAQDACGETPLHVAARLATEGCMRLAQLLLDPAEFNDFIVDGVDSEDDDDDEDGGAPAPKAPAANVTFRLQESHVTKVFSVADENGFTVLHTAASEPAASPLAHFLIERAGPKHINTTGRRGTALMQACSVGNAEVAEALLAAGADVSIASEEGCTALHEACTDGSAELVSRILEHSREPAFVNKQSLADGGTALHYAAQNGHVATVQLLAEVEGAALDHEDSEGSTPIATAWVNGHDAVVTLLEKLGVSAEGLDEALLAANAVLSKEEEVVVDAAERSLTVEERMARIKDRKKAERDARRAERAERTKEAAAAGGGGEAEDEDDKAEEEADKAEEAREKEAEVGGRMERILEKKKKEAKVAKAAEAEKEGGLGMNAATVILVMFAFSMCVVPLVQFATMMGWIAEGPAPQEASA